MLDQVRELKLKPSRLLLRLPLTVRHEIDEQSPLANWRGGKGALNTDADSEIVVSV